MLTHKQGPAVPARAVDPTALSRTIRPGFALKTVLDEQYGYHADVAASEQLPRTVRRLERRARFFDEMLELERESAVKA